MSAELVWVSSPASALRGDIVVPGDKSVSHRALMLGAIAKGSTRIAGFLESGDTTATEHILRTLGVRIDAPKRNERIVHGVGLHGLRARGQELDCGNSGTAMRLLSGLLAGQSFDSVLIGDQSLSRRPMRRVIEPLTAMGAQVEASDDELPPLRIRGRRALRGVDYHSPVASAQVKSAVLLAGLYAQGETCVTEPQPTRDYTEHMLAAFGWPVEFGPGRAKLTGGHALMAADVFVPADFSSAAFLIVAATLIPGSQLRLRDVGLNPRRTGLLHVLRAMGANVAEENAREVGNERIADLCVRYAPLRGVEVLPQCVADMIDEFPILFVAAACARGTTTIRNAAELRVKESDRIAVMTKGLRALGIEAEEASDGAVIGGGSLRGGDVDALGDHRCAMAFAVAGAAARQPVQIRDCANVVTSFPEFARVANACGMRLAPA